MKTVILHPSSTKEFHFLIGLMKRLNVSFDIQEDVSDEVEAVDSVAQLFGSWESDETGEELIEQIYSSRMDAPRKVEL